MTRKGAAWRWVLLSGLSGLSAVSVLLAACGSPSAAQGSSPGFTAGAPDLPEIVMGGPDGLLLWTSGSASVLLASVDGFHTFTNASPPAVPTAGGLAVGRDGGQIFVGVRPTGDLTTSPFLLGDGTRGGWTAGELPGTLDAWPHAVALRDGTVRALIGSGSTGRLVETTDAGVTWRVAAQASQLDPSRQLSLTGVGWTGPDRGWLSGVAGGGHAALFRADAGSSTWHPVAFAGSPATGQMSASLPCGSGDSLVTVLLTRGSGAARAVVERTADGGAQWTAGAPQALPAGDPAWTCSQGVPGVVWLAVPGPGAGRMLASLDGGASWTDEGQPPGVVASLAITGAGTGYAVTGRGSTARLWSVAGNGAGFTEIPLPAWVAKLSDGGES